MPRRRMMHWRSATDPFASAPNAPGELSDHDHTDSDEPVVEGTVGPSPVGSPVVSAVDESLVDAAFDEADFDSEIAQLYADDSEALARWKDRLSGYVDLQGTLDALRLRPSSEQPWPAFDNPMLGYLKERGAEIAAHDGLDAAIAWLAANAWFEGAIAERSRFIRLLDAD
jgi:hypothetical protein